MKKLQQGSAAVTVFLILLIVILAIGAYMYVHRSDTPVVTQTSTTVPSQTVTSNDTASVDSTTTPPSDTTSLPPHATPDPVSKVYTDRTFGYSVTYTKTRTASTDKAGKVTLTAGAGIAPITIVKANNSADTSTGKWGKNVLSYSTSGWVTQLQSEKDGSIYTTATVPFSSTASGLPIFTGGTRHGFGLSVYVVALSHTKFLIISGGEGLTDIHGYDYSTDPTLAIAKSVAIF